MFVNINICDISALVQWDALNDDIMDGPEADHQHIYTYVQTLRSVSSYIYILSRVYFISTNTVTQPHHLYSTTQILQHM